MNDNTSAIESAALEQEPSAIARFRALAASVDFPTRPLTLDGARSLGLFLLIVSWLFPPYTEPVGNFYQNSFRFLLGTETLRGSIDPQRLLLINLIVVSYTWIMYKNFWVYNWSVRFGLCLALIFGIAVLSFRYLPM